MERFFILDKVNTWYNWNLILTAKDVTPPEPKTNYVDIDGMSGSLDLSESLTGEITYKDRTVSASFWTDTGTHKDRDRLFREITTALHGKKIKIIEPDDLDHYFYGRVKVKSFKNNRSYAEITLEATCEPWRYAVEDSVRYVEVSSPIVTNVIIRNQGVRTLSPVITVTGTVDITYNGGKTSLTNGDYKISDLKLYHGFNIIGVSGDGSVTFTYKEADL